MFFTYFGYLADTCFANIFLHSVVVFSPSDWCPLKHKSFKFWWISTYPLCPFATCVFQKPLPKPRSRGLYRCFFLWVSESQLLHLLGLWSIWGQYLKVVQGRSPTALFSMWVSRYPRTVCWRDCSSRLNDLGIALDYMCMHLFLLCFLTNRYVWQTNIWHAGLALLRILVC